jgi:hypothetical protein
MSQPREREKLQRLVQDGARKGLEWRQGAVAEICKDDLRAMVTAAGLPVRANSSKKWLTMPELREALLAYLASEATKVGSCLTASCKDDMCNWDGVLLLFDNMFRN